MILTALAAKRVRGSVSYRRGPAALLLLAAWQICRRWGPEKLVGGMGGLGRPKRPSRPGCREASAGPRGGGFCGRFLCLVDRQQPRRVPAPKASVYDAFGEVALCSMNKPGTREGAGTCSAIQHVADAFSRRFNLGGVINGRARLRRRL